MRVEELKGGKLSELCPEDWHSQDGKINFWLRMYSVLLVNHQVFLDFTSGRPEYLVNAQKVKVFFLKVGGLEENDISMRMHSNTEGVTCIDIGGSPKKLPDTIYIALMTPIIEGEQENSIKERLDVVASLLRAHMGNNALRDIYFDSNVTEDKTNKYGQAVRLPNPTEGPFLVKQNISDVEEILVRISESPKKDRFQLALHFFELARLGKESFFYYWTAFEVLCDGKASKIQTDISKCYGIRSHKQAGEDIGFRKIADWRHDLIHFGKRHSLSADVERYMQLLFLDLLRFKLNLLPRYNVPAIQQAVGYDLRDLGLADNRIKEERAA